MKDSLICSKGSIALVSSYVFKNVVSLLKYTFSALQARYKEAREGRKMKINSSYKYIFEILSDRLALDITAVEDLILDNPTVSLLYYNYFYN